MRTYKHYIIDEIHKHIYELWLLVGHAIHGICRFKLRVGRGHPFKNLINNSRTCKVSTTTKYK